MQKMIILLTYFVLFVQMGLNVIVKLMMMMDDGEQIVG